MFVNGGTIQVLGNLRHGGKVGESPEEGKGDPGCSPARSRVSTALLPAFPPPS